MKIALTSLLVSTGTLTSTMAWRDQCAGFKADSVDNIRNVTTLYYTAGSLVNLTSLYTPLSTSNLPAFCRVQFTVVTNPSTGKTAQAELWLPDGWNKRVIGYGNGGWSGGCKSASIHMPQVSSAPVDLPILAIVQYLTVPWARTVYIKVTLVMVLILVSLHETHLESAVQAFSSRPSKQLQGRILGTRKR